ncbi:MAG: DUF938 domain-containing protein [Myxococcales bacterium]|nr:DUF938 domain-containing protein [Myxococcales bacterium]
METPSAGDRRRHAPAAARNREAIAEVLARTLPARGLLLEIGAGTGEHAAHLAPRHPTLTWQPSDPSPEARESIDAWREHVGAANLQPAIDLDAGASTWPIDQAGVDVIMAINVLHISPWSTAEGLMAGAGRHLGAGGIVYLYGPYRIDGEHTTPSNRDFDASLRARDPSWGVRDIGEVAALAAAHGLVLAERVAMPANNFSLIFRRR